MAGKSRTWALALALALLAGCGSDSRDDAGSGSSGTAATATGTGGPVPTVRARTKEGLVEIRVEVAEPAEERRTGLMNRASLAPDAGMLFVFPEETRGSFWMKNTLVPLSIAFLDGRGRVLRILDMEPCRRDPCPLYDPDVSYVAALEVNRGAFRRWGVGEGDYLELPET